MLNNAIAKTGKSLREIESITGVDYSRLSKILNNKISPSYDTMHRIITKLSFSDVEIIQIMKYGDIKGKSYRLKIHNDPKDEVVDSEDKK